MTNEEEIMVSEAIEKIRKEKSDGKFSRTGQVVKESVYEQICTWCNDEPEFARAIIDQSDKNFVQCCEVCVKDCGSAISDVAVFERAAKYYFETAKVKATVKIILNPASDPELGVRINLADFM